MQWWSNWHKTVVNFRPQSRLVITALLYFGYMIFNIHIHFALKSYLKECVPGIIMRQTLKNYVPVKYIQASMDNKN